MRTLLLLLSVTLLALALRPREIKTDKPGVFIRDLKCQADPKLTVDSITKTPKYREQIQKYFWPNSCGRARGVFIIDDRKEYEGKTYSCANFPPQWNVQTPNDFFTNPSKYKEHLDYMNLYIGGVFNTTAVKGPNTCDFYGFSKLYCGDDYEYPWKKAPWAQKIGNKPLRGVNIGGLFVLEPWITANFTKWKIGYDDQYSYSVQNPVGSAGALYMYEHWNNWYKADDFKLMKQYGLNAVRLPLGWWYFGKDAGVNPDPYLVPDADIMTNVTHPVTKLIGMAKAAGITVILDLHGAPGSQNGLDNSGRRSTETNPELWGNDWFYEKKYLTQTTAICVSMAKYIKFLEQNNMDNVIALQLLNEPWVFGDMSIIRDWYKDTITAVRAVHQDIPIVIHDAFRHSEWAWLTNDWKFKNTFMDTHIYHAFNSDDIASSNPSCDKLKQTIAENIACGYGSMLRYKTCTSLPTFVGEWSLAIDDCMGHLRGTDISVQFHDYGQCKNLAMRTGDKWWVEHVNSFAAKQMYMAERELGWFFWTWKTGYGSEKDVSNPLWSFKDAVTAGFITTPITDQWLEPTCHFFVEDGGKC
jgi:glucan 1,3-beta-glucosidase